MKRKHSASAHILTLAVIGHPVAHSLSPAMQNAALRQLKLPYHYKKIHVLPEELKNFCKVAKSRTQNLAGFNLTLPHKESVLSYLDWIAPAAEQIGAVNTVVVHRGRLLGFNTDGLGYIESLKEETKLELKGIHATVLGAGGAARAVAAALAESGVAHITLANRSLSRAKNLAKHLCAYFPHTHFQVTEICGAEFHRALSKSQLITNTTSIGLSAQDFSKSFPDFPWQQLACVCSDLVYKPLMTPFLKAAQVRQLTIHSGLGMLVHQGALSFQLWTGQYPDVKLMRRVVENL